MVRQEREDEDLTPEKAAIKAAAEAAERARRVTVTMEFIVHPNKVPVLLQGGRLAAIQAGVGGEDIDHPGKNPNPFIYSVGQEINFTEASALIEIPAPMEIPQEVPQEEPGQ